MKRLTAPWTTALATAALIALPAAGSAQTPQTQPEPQPQQSTTLSTPAQDQKPTESESPAEHLRQAKAALENVDANNVPARAKTQLAALKRHINSLERSVAANDNASTTGATARSPKATTGARGQANWAADVAAVDKIITELTADGSAAAMGSGQSSTTGTSGAEPRTEAKTGTTSAAITLDETSRGQLMEVRSHITAFAAAMSGSAAPSASSSTSPATPTAAHSGSAHGSAATGHAGAATTAPTGSATGETAQTSQPAPAAGQSSSTPSSTPTGTAGQTPPTDQAPTTGEPGQPAEAEQSSVDPEAAKQHLTAARDSLTQLTQLPAAAQLQGDARTQVSQLIQNFNELITTQENWRAVYDKVEANLTALIGPDQEKTDAAAAPTDAPQPTTPDPSATTPPSSTPGTQGTSGTPSPTPETPSTQQGTPGAVGTSGTATLDAAVKQKLVEFRNHLKAFHAAAGGDEK